MDTMLTIIFPVFALVGLGFAIVRPPLFPAEFSRMLGNFIFYLALPALLFRSMAARGLPHGEELRLLAAYYSALLVVVAGSIAYARWCYKESMAGAAALMLGACFSNLVLVGVPLILSAYGEAGLQQMLLIATTHTAFLVGSATVMAEASRSGQGGGIARTIGNTLKALVRNPIIVAILSGLAFGSVGLRLPGPLDAALAMLGQAAVPCSLIALGASLVGIPLTDLVGRTLFMVLVKLAILPAAIFVSGRYIFDLPPLALAVAVTGASLPSGLNAVLFSMRYQQHEGRLSSATLLGTILSAVSTAMIIDYFRAL